MTVPSAIIAERPTVNYPILAQPDWCVDPQICTVAVTLNGIERLPPVGEWCFLQALKPLDGELSAVLGKKINHARVREVS